MPDLLPPAPELVTPLAILDRLVVPGTRLQLEWRPGGGISNAEIASPVIVARGALAGPVLCLVAGIHGDEINGVEIVRRIAHSVDPTRLSGTVIGVPIVNVFGYSRGTRYLPDRRDLNRYFPGSRHGSIASRIANGFSRTSCGTATCWWISTPAASTAATCRRCAPT
nr:succinylglutamate desuccinylase/aspartoacylase family protein [Arenimonas daejeonensis]